MDEPSKTSIAQRLAEQVARAQPEPGRSGPSEGEGPDADRDDNVLRHILPGQHLARIPVDLISPAPDGQARQDFNEERLQSLAESLRRSGVREPIIVTPHGAEPGRFQIVAGERRWRAARLAKLAEIPCIVDPALQDRKDKVLAQAEENLHRENLNAVEEAAVLAQLMEERGIDVREAGELMGKTYRQARRIHQLHTAAPPIKRAVMKGQLDSRVALEMVRIHNRFAREDESPSGSKALRRIERLIEQFIRDSWTVRRLEDYASKLEGSDGDASERGTESRSDDDTRQSPRALRSTKAVPPVAASHGEMAGQLVVTKGSLIVIDKERVERGSFSPEERESLIDLLEGLLMTVRRV